MYNTVVSGTKAKAAVGDIVHTAVLLTTVDVDTVLKIAKEWTQYSSEAGKSGLVFEHGLQVPYGLGGIGAEHARPEEASKRQYVGIITGNDKVCFVLLFLLLLTYYRRHSYLKHEV